MTTTSHKKELAYPLVIEALTTAAEQCTVSESFIERKFVRCNPEHCIVIANVMRHFHVSREKINQIIEHLQNKDFEAGEALLRKLFDRMGYLEMFFGGLMHGTSCEDKRFTRAFHTYNLAYTVVSQMILISIVDEEKDGSQSKEVGGTTEGKT